jgi:transposase-like protein
MKDGGMASKKQKETRKRYSSEEKEKIVAFVLKHNESAGRGGAAAASKQFGISQITIGSWVKGAVGAGTAKNKMGGKRGANDVAAILNELSKLDAKISAKRDELAALEAQFEKLKRSL